MTTKNIKAVIFDLDGTLLNSLADLAKSGNELLVRHHLPPYREEEYRYFVGNGSKTLLERIFPPMEEEKILKLLQEYQTIYQQNICTETKPYRGIEELLAKIEHAKIHLAVCTNKPEDLAKALVKRLLPKTHFSFVIGDSGVFPPKPDPKGVLFIASKWQIKPQNILYVGDSMVDMETAKRGEMTPCGVLWGFRTKEELIEHGAKYIVEEPSEIWEKILHVEET